MRRNEIVSRKYHACSEIYKKLCLLRGHPKVDRPPPSLPCGETYLWPDKLHSLTHRGILGARNVGAVKTQSWLSGSLYYLLGEKKKHKNMESQWSQTL